MGFPADRETEIRSCLAYEVLGNPELWLGAPSLRWLRAFLFGAQIRADNVPPALPTWRVSCVLNDLAFYQRYLDATGHPTLSIMWDTAIEMTCFSFAEGFFELRKDALAWHRAHGAAPEEPYDALSNQGTNSWNVDRFWEDLAKRTPMYTGDWTGWTLYCFLNGMDRGGDWLGLPPMPRLREIFGTIQAQSTDAYGSPFAAFRRLHADKLLEWAGLPSDAQSE